MENLDRRRSLLGLVFVVFFFFLFFFRLRLSRRVVSCCALPCPALSRGESW